MLLRLKDAAKGLCDQVAFERGDVFGWDCGRYAGGFCEHVNEAEDEEAWEGAAEVGHAGCLLVNQSQGRWRAGTTDVASKVIYVPPICGSAILAWKAEMATNMTVDMKVLKTCSTMTRSR